MNVVIVIIIGAIIGLIGGLIMRSKYYGLLINIGTGVVGALIGEWAIKSISYTSEDDRITATLISATIVSIIVVWLIGLLRRKG